VLSATLAALLNRGLPRSPRARELCALLKGRSVLVVVREIVQLRIESDGGVLTVALADSAAALTADATISGGPLALLSLTGDGAQAALQRGAVEITGDTDIATQFRELLRLLRPDLEEELSLVVGDVAAHQFGRLARFGANLGSQAAGTACDNLAEYLGHERADLVPRNEGEHFLRGVDTLREAVDRAQARIEQLQRRRGAP
jgi:ubiquinone biosynthesis accessory factor UbiJ